MRHHSRAVVGMLVCVAFWSCAPDAAAQLSAPDFQLEARKPLLGVPVHLSGNFPHRVVVKFNDDLKVRGQGAALQATQDDAANRLQAMAHDYQLHFRPLFDLPDDTLAAMEQRAVTLAKRVQPDLRGIMVAEHPGASNEELLVLARALDALDETEYVYLEPLGVPPPGDIAPTTPSYTNLQTFFAETPGLNVPAAWARGAKGSGIRLSDCEYGWNTDHEDLKGVDVRAEPGQTPHDEVRRKGYDQHGTAVLGESSALVNDYGVSGIVPAAEIHTFSEWTNEGGSRRAAAVAAAIAQSRPGDVVLLEMQTPGPNGQYIPAEYSPAVWTVVKNGVDQGVIVVAAAGNGGQNLDGPMFDWYRSQGNSGAIIVGAGSPDSQHQRLSFSTYGSRVDVQGWGENVVTTGYGDVARLGGDINQAYTRFSGTSSASPMVASTAVAIQSYAKANLGRVLLPAEMRSLLRSTGTPQGSPDKGLIGPLPNIGAALDALGGPTVNQKPTVNFSKPLPNAVVNEIVELSATAADADGRVVKVVFTLPDNSIVEDTTAPYAAQWNSRTVTNGSYSASARAFDDQGDWAQVSTTITVNNAAPSGCLDGTFSASGLPLAIPDNNVAGVPSTLSIGGEGTVATLSLSLNIKHSYRGDLIVKLQSPSGTSWNVHNKAGGSADDLTLTDVASNAFQGVPAAGTWTLQVVDAAQADTGALVTWSLKIKGSCGTPTAGWSASAQPGLTLRDNGEVCTSLLVSQTGEASRVKLDVAGRHSYRSILSATLKHGATTVVAFPTKTFSTGTGEYQLSDRAVPGFSGDAQGEWVLCVKDTDAFGDSGLLNSWRVHD